MAETLAQVIAKIYTGSGGLNTGSVNKEAVLYNINKARSLGASTAQLNLLNQAYQQTTRGDYRGAATNVWYIMGSPASQRPFQTAVKTAVVAGGASAAKVLTTVNNATQNTAAKTVTAVNNAISSATGGYTVTMSHSDQNAFVRTNQTRKAKGMALLSEDEFRRQKGISTQRDASIKYVAPKLTGGNKSAASTGNKSTGVSNDLSGSQKIAAQSKVNPSNNKPTVIASTKPSSVSATKPVTTVTTKQPVSTVVKKTVSLSAASNGKRILDAMNQTTTTENGKTIWKSSIDTATEKKQEWQAYQDRQKLGKEGYQAAVKAGTATASVKNDNYSSALQAVKDAAAKAKKDAAYVAKNYVAPKDKSGNVIQAISGGHAASSNVSLVAPIFATKNDKNTNQYQLKSEYQDLVKSGKTSKGSATQITTQPVINFAKSGSAYAAEAAAQNRYDRAVQKYNAQVAAQQQNTASTPPETRTIYTDVRKYTGILGNKLDNVLPISKTFGADKSGFGLVGVASATSGNAAKSSSKDLTAITNKSLMGAVSGIFPAVGIVSAGGNYLAGKAGNYLASTQKSQTQLPASGDYRDINGWKLMSKEHQDSIIKNNSRAAYVGGTLTYVGVSPTTANQATTAVYNSLNGVSNKLASSDAIVSPYTKRLPDADKVANTLTKYHAEKAIAATPFSGLGVVGSVYNTITKGIDKSPEFVKSSKPANFVSGSISAQKDIAAGLGAQTKEDYDRFRVKPVTASAEYGAFYASGELLGAATTGVKLATASKFARASEGALAVTTKVATKIDNPIVTKGLGLVGKGSKYILQDGKILDIGMTGALGIDATTRVGSGYANQGWKGVGKETAKFGTELLVGGFGFEKGAVKANRVAQGDYTALVPLAKRAKITEVISNGADSDYLDLNYGYSLAVGNKPLLTYVSGKGVKGVRIGAAGAPAEALAGKVTQSFSKLDNRFFEKTVKSNANAVESEYLNSALRIAKSVTSSRKPLFTPEKFEITSTAVPDVAKSPITKALKSYNGRVQVAGSVPMKAQADPFVTRETHDLEIYGDDVAALSKHITGYLEKSGLKSGKDFMIDENRIQFKTGDSWDTGIEIFAHGKNAKPLSTDSPNPKSSSQGRSEIAFGYNSRKPVRIGNKKEGFIETQDLAEQVTRKIAGSTFFMENKLQPSHPGRVKDIGDTITTATRFAVGGKANPSDVITFTNAAYEKFGSSPRDGELGKALKDAGQLTNAERLAELNKKGLSKTEADKAEIAEIKAKLEKAGVIDTAKKYIYDMKLHKNFMEKVASDPVVDYIHKTQRLPTEADMGSISTKQLLYDSATPAKAVGGSTGNALVDDAIASSSKVDVSLNKKPSFRDVEKAFESKSTGVSEMLKGERSNSPKTIQRPTNRSPELSPSPASKGTSKQVGLGYSPSPTAFAGAKTPSPKPNIGLGAQTRANIADIINNDKSPNTRTTTLKNTNNAAISDIIRSPKPTKIVDNAKTQVTKNKNEKSPKPKNNDVMSSSPSLIPPSQTPSIVSPSPNPSPSPSPNPSPSPSPKIPSIISPSPNPSPSPSPKPSPSPSPSPSPNPSPSPSPSPDPLPYPYVPAKGGYSSEGVVGREDGGLPPILGGSNQGWGLMGKHGMISNTKVATFEEMVGKKATSRGIGKAISTGMSVTQPAATPKISPTNQNKEVQLTKKSSKKPAEKLSASQIAVKKSAPQIVKSPVKKMQPKKASKPSIKK